MGEEGQGYENVAETMCPAQQEGLNKIGFIMQPTK
jgi:hypothetical protein